MCVRSRVVPRLGVDSHHISIIFHCIIPGAAFTMPSGSFVVARTLFANKISLPQLPAATGVEQLTSSNQIEMGDIKKWDLKLI